MNNLELTTQYYDHHWKAGESLSPREEGRIRKTISLIPEHAASVLDAGCGDGRIANRLISRYSKVVALESSHEALQGVKAHKILGSIDLLPFPDRSFELVLCCEVLEHLPFKVYCKALTEIERVAGRYILVTVPNNENIRQGLVTCPQCGCVFHPWRHLRSFKPEHMANLFNRFSPQVARICQPLDKSYPPLMIKVGKLLKLVPAFPSTALCPRCGYTSTSRTLSSNSAKEGFLHSLIPLARRLAPVKKHRGWLMILYHRNQIGSSCREPKLRG